MGCWVKPFSFYLFVRASPKACGEARVKALPNGALNFGMTQRLQPEKFFEDRLILKYLIVIMVKVINSSIFYGQYSICFYVQMTFHESLCLPLLCYSVIFK
jgi:hypothetical protein